jgi:hypothetical protein
MLKCFNYSLEAGSPLKLKEVGACLIDGSMAYNRSLQHRDTPLQEYCSSRFVCYAADLLFVEALLPIPPQRR